MKSQTPHETICAVISILQARAMASDSAVDGPASWGVMFMPTACIDLAIDMLIDILPGLETLPDFAGRK